MRKLLCLFAFLCYLLPGKAQTLRVDKVHSDNYCLGSELNIDVTITGTFAADNQFTVVAYRGWAENEQRWEYPAELKGNRFVTVLTDKELGNARRLGLRIVSSSPKTETGAGVFFSPLVTPLVTLSTKSGYTGDTLNSTDLIELALTATPPGPGQITLNTGEKFNLRYYDDDWPNSLTTFISLPKTEEGTYSIAEAGNVCGAIKASGEVQIRVNPINFFPVNISPKHLCEGSEFKVLFNTEGPALPSGARFKVRFSADFNDRLVRQKYIDVPVTLTGSNELTGIFPSGVDGSEYDEELLVGIVTENPAAIGLNKELKVRWKPRPGFSLQTGKPIIDLGEEIYISPNPVGYPPFRFTLSTGTGETFDLENNFFDFPKTTTTYQVTKMESGCGTIENPPGSALTIEVRPGLFLGEIGGGYRPPTSFCEGQTARLRYHANGVNPNTTYIVNLGDFDNTFFSLPAKAVGDSIEFFIPALTGEDPDLNYGNVSTIRLVSSNPGLISHPQGIRIHGKPFVTMAEQSQNSVPFPSTLRMYYNVYGGYPYTIEMEDGTTESYDYRNIWFDRFIQKDTIFRFAAISNHCFRNTDLPVFPIKVGNPASPEPALFLRLIDKEYCIGDSVEVEVFFNGEFEAGNEFTLSYLRSATITTYPIMKVSKPGVYKLKLADDIQRTFEVSLQLSSSLPRLISETGRFSFRPIPWGPAINPQASREAPEPVYLESRRDVTAHSTSNSLFTYSYDGVEGTAVSDNTGDIRIPMRLANNQVSEFKVLSVSNSCGAITSNAASYFYGVAYKIVLDSYMNDYFTRCAGMPTEVPFRLENGKAKADTRFTLQISPEGWPLTYTDIATATGTYIFRFNVPQLKAGRYIVRVKSSDDLYSDGIQFLIGEAPTAVIRFNDKPVADTTVFVDYGSVFAFNTLLSGNEPMGVLLSNGERHISNSIYFGHSIKITENQTFSIKNIWNSCGYGTSSGQVHIKVRPAIELSVYPEGSDAIACAGAEIELDYAIKGGDETRRDYIVFSLLQPGSAPVKLDSVDNIKGRIRLKIPGNISQTYLTIRAEITALQASRTVTYQVYSSPDVTLFGSSTITEGESTVLYVRANNTFAENTTVRLSDGSAHNITSPFPNGITELTVRPRATTTYTLVAPSSQCGTASVTGSATVTVEPRLSQWLSVSGIAGTGSKSTICNSDTLQVFFDIHGGQAPATGYTLLLSDPAGSNFVSIPTLGTSSPVSGIIPSSVKESDFYRIRLLSQDQSVSGSTYTGTISVGEYATANVLMPHAYYHPGEPVETVVSLTGSKPVYYHFGDYNFAQYRNSGNEKDTIRLFPGTPLATYRIIDVGNKCGPGHIGADSTFRIELITSREPVTEPETVRMGPNPTPGLLTLYFNNDAERYFEMFNLGGQKVYKAMSYRDNFTADLSHIPPGVYLLSIRTKEKHMTYKILKH